MHKTKTRKSIPTANVETLFALPPGTRQIVIEPVSGFEVRVSLTTGEVAGGGGFSLANGFVLDSRQMASIPGPVYMASSQAGVIVEMDAYFVCEIAHVGDFSPVDFDPVDFGT